VGLSGRGGGEGRDRELGAVGGKGVGGGVGGVVDYCRRKTEIQFMRETVVMCGEEREGGSFGDGIHRGSRLLEGTVAGARARALV
jgi:hypothetical protein